MPAAAAPSNPRGLRRLLSLGFGLLLLLTVLMALFCTSRLTVIHNYNTSLDERAYRLSLANQWLTQTHVAAAKGAAADAAAAGVIAKLQALVPAGAEKVALQAALAAAGAPIAAQASAVQQVTDEMVRLQIADSAGLQAASRQAFVLLGVLTLASLIAGVAVAMLITRSITRPVAQALRATDLIARGELFHDIQSDRPDELGALLRGVAAMQAQLRDMLAKARQASDGIETASAEIAQGNADLSHRTETAASNLQQAASSVEELTSTMRHSADAATRADALATSAAEVARRGGAVVSRVVTTMADINAGSKRIADIVGVIDGIAFQTNILALNAAVEAARAGEQGRGFAVVAGEVRTLAQRSATAAREIKTLIGASVTNVETGAQLVQQAGSTMSDIVGSVERVTEVIGGITLAASEQSGGIVQINQAVTQLDHVTQQNAALSEQTAAAAESLRTQARHLCEAMARFRLSPGEKAAP